MASDKAYTTEQRLAALLAVTGTLLPAGGSYLQLPQITTPAGTRIVYMDTSGCWRTRNADGNTYNIETAHGIATATPQAISGAVGTYTSITGLSLAVASGITYRFSGLITCTQGPNGNQQNFRFTAPAVSAGRYNGAVLVNAGSVGLSSATAPSTAITTQAILTGTTFFAIISGWFTFSAAGTLQFQAGQGGTGGAFTVVDAVLDISPAA